MTDKNNESALLLRMNKEEQVSVLQEIGFTSVNENTPASDIAKYIRWAGGLLDLSFATIRIEDGVNVFFTAEEWNSLSANNRSKYLRIGVRIRADRRQFVIAKSDCTDDIGGRTFKWGAYGTDIRGVKNYGNGNQGLYETADGKQNTDAIIEATAGVKDNSGVVGAPAAEAAKNYKACTLELDGLEDKTEWYLPSEGELITIAKYKTEINELLSSVSGNQNIITTDWYWSSTEYDASAAWNVTMHSGNVAIAIDAGHGGTDIGAEGVINEIQLTEATIGYLEGWLTQDENYTPVRTHAADTFSKNTERAAAANSAGASLLLSVHGNSDPYSSDSYGLECYPQPPGRTHHEDSLRLAHLIADKFGAAGQRLRGNAGVRYIYYAGDDESGYEKQVVEESDSTVYSEQTFGLLKKTDCPAVLVEQCFVTSEADVAAWGTDDGCRRAARLYYEAICEYFGTEPLPGT